MKKTTVMLDSISAVKKFVNIVTAYDFDVDLASGRYAVDAKSIMGIFSLICPSRSSSPLTLMTLTSSLQRSQSSS